MHRLFQEQPGEQQGPRGHAADHRGATRNQRQLDFQLCQSERETRRDSRDSRPVNRAAAGFFERPLRPLSGAGRAQRAQQPATIPWLGLFERWVRPPITPPRDVVAKLKQIASGPAVPMAQRPSATCQ